MSFAIITLILISTLSYCAWEYHKHQSNLAQIPIRIHVNGTRGKSSVTRLIGAGLRAGGYQTITKVTGTFPRMILHDGTEVAVHRKQGANILEQLKIIDYCVKKKAEVLLIECMALQPQYQKITEHQMVRATHGVITNIRLDHLDVMGPRLHNVAEALTLTVPKNAKIFTSEDRLLHYIEKKAQKLNTEVFDCANIEVSSEDMQGFTYFEHPVNVSLALAICENLKVDRAVALKAMKKTIPDEGAMRKFTLIREDKCIHLYNGLAANDPESSTILWNSILDMEGEDDIQYLLLINSRKDRKERSEQLVHMAASLEFDQLVLAGENVNLVETMALKKGIDQSRIVSIGQTSPEEQISNLIPYLRNKVVLVAFGNMGAGGADLVKYFETNHYIK